MEQSIKQVVIVGGGSAGWLTAALIAAELRSDLPGNLQVTLIESPDVPPIGVGEGTWPSMRDTLRRVGVSETEFFRQCDASFKQGTRFRGWVDGDVGHHYDHPFVLPEGYTEANLVAQWRRQHARRPFAEVVCFQSTLCNAGLAPKQPQTPEFAAVANYGYHLDAGKFGVFLRQHCIDKLGVRHVLDHMDGVNAADNGDIASLSTRHHGLLEADLFIDCTGMASLLLGQHYGIPLRSEREVLFNDSALAIQVPYPRDDTPIASQTHSVAQKNGWIWDIGLPTRRGVGYVYSSAHTDDEGARSELLAYLRASGAPEELAEPRQLRFAPGYRETLWHRNCVAVGLSSGFIEPLEASALALVEMSATMLAEQMPATRADLVLVAERFNRAFRYRWSRVIDFLKLHYVLSTRDDQRYWREHREPGSIPDRLLEQLRLWRHQPPSRYDFSQIEEMFPSASYQYVLYGMGFEPAYASERGSDRPAVAEQFFRQAADLGARMARALPSNRTLIEHIHKVGLTRI